MMLRNFSSSTSHRLTQSLLRSCSQTYRYSTSNTQHTDAPEQQQPSPSASQLQHLERVQKHQEQRLQQQQEKQQQHRRELYNIRRSLKNPPPENMAKKPVFINWKGKAADTEIEPMHGGENGITVLDDSCFKPTTLSGQFWQAQRLKFYYGFSRHYLYKSCTEELDYVQIMEHCEMEDTFASWFTIVHLHVWMLLVRLRLVGAQGKRLSWFLIDVMWTDMRARAKLLGVRSREHKLETFRALESRFHSLLFLYDEAILEDDAVLASALWWAFFDTTRGDDPIEGVVLSREGSDNKVVQVARMVEYVRKNTQYLETIDSHHLVVCGIIKWRPLYDDVVKDDEPQEDADPALLASAEVDPPEAST